VDERFLGGGIIRAVSELPAVGRTAIGVARVRAGESRRPDPLFDDPYAAAFVAAAGPSAGPADGAEPSAAQRRWRAAIAFHISIRTRFFDDYLLAAVDAGVRQVVLLGAGLDTRAYRLDWPAGVRWFELDRPDVLAFKQRVLDEQRARPRCDRVALAADLAGDWAGPLEAAGWRPGVPTAWLAEGLLVYLDRLTAEHVLTVVTTLSAGGSRLAVERGDVASQVAAIDPDQRPDEASALWRGGLGGSPGAWMNIHGWRTSEHEAPDVAAAYGRRSAGSARSGFVTATR
jgi:methyltransferase (TIGR00027 family)